MTSEREINWNFPRCDGKDFAVWKTKVEAIVIAKGFKDILKARPSLKAGANDAEKKKHEQELVLFDKRDSELRAPLLTCLDDNIARLVLRCESSYKIWTRLNTMHEKRSKSKQSLDASRFLFD